MRGRQVEISIAQHRASGTATRNKIHTATHSLYRSITPGRDIKLTPPLYIHKASRRTITKSQYIFPRGTHWHIPPKAIQHQPTLSTIPSRHSSTRSNRLRLATTTTAIPAPPPLTNKRPTNRTKKTPPNKRSPSRPQQPAPPPYPRPPNNHSSPASRWSS